MRLVTATILLTALLGAPTALLADDEAKPAADSGGGIRAALQKNKGNRVSLRVGGGDDITGKVASVGGETVHLTELAGREFFDAVVAIDDVSAVVFRAAGK